MPYLMDMVLDDFKYSIELEIDQIMKKYYGTSYKIYLKSVLEPIIIKLQPLKREILSIIKFIKQHYHDI